MRSARTAGVVRYSFHPSRDLLHRPSSVSQHRGERGAVLVGLAKEKGEIVYPRFVLGQGAGAVELGGRGGGAAEHVEVLSVNKPHVVDFTVDAHVPVFLGHDLVEKRQRAAELAVIVVAAEGVTIGIVDGEMHRGGEADVELDLENFGARHRENAIH